MRRPRLVVHVAVSLDGATTGFAADVGRYYALAATFGEDVTLAGADTILAQEAALRAAPRPAGDRRWHGPQPPPATLALRSAEPLDGGLVWLRYEI